MTFRSQKLGFVVVLARIALVSVAMVALVTRLPSANAPGTKDKSTSPKKAAPLASPSQWAEWNSVLRFRGQLEASLQVKHFRQNSSEVTKSDTLQTAAGSFVLEGNDEGRWVTVSVEVAGSVHFVFTMASWERD